MRFPSTFCFPSSPLPPLKSPSKWFWKLVPVSLPGFLLQSAVQNRDRSVVLSVFCCYGHFMSLHRGGVLRYSIVTYNGKIEKICPRFVLEALKVI